MPHESTIRVVQLDLIRIDGGTQIRQRIDQEIVGEYAEKMRGGEAFDPVVVFNDGTEMWLADGFHRYHATRAAGLKEMSAAVRPGTQRDAILYACGANADHGLRRTNEDKRKAVLTLLQDKEWAKWSNREIGDAARVSNTTVMRIRDELLQSSTCQHPDTRIGRDGKSYPAKRKPAPPDDEPEILDGDTCDEDGTDEVEEPAAKPSKFDDEERERIVEDSARGYAALDGKPEPERKEVKPRSIEERFNTLLERIDEGTRLSSGTLAVKIIITARRAAVADGEDEERLVQRYLRLIGRA